MRVATPGRLYIYIYISLSDSMARGATQWRRLTGGVQGAYIYIYKRPGGVTKLARLVENGATRGK